MNSTQLPAARLPSVSDLGLAVFRGIGQVFFQENALTGLLFVIGIACASLPMAVGAVAGAVIGTATALIAKFDDKLILAGIYGFNATLVGIATLFFFEPGAGSIVLLVLGSIAATLVTRYARMLAFPTYTAPFIVVTWIVYFVGKGISLPMVDLSGSTVGSELTYLPATIHGVSQVMFQASYWTGLFFLLGIAISDWRHAKWVLVASFLGALAASYHFSATAKALDVEMMGRAHTEVIALGLYGYNATLAAVALYLWRRSLIAPLFGALLTVPIAEMFPLLGLPALTAPFVLATWLVLILGWMEALVFEEGIVSDL